MSATEAILEADGVRLVFFRQGDRYAHRVEVQSPSKPDWIATLESLEGSESDEWPPSPPLQQLHIEHRPTGDVILLVGMAGRTHWSAAVEVAADRRGFVFECAARTAKSPQRLGSEYRRAAATAAEPPLCFRPEMPLIVPFTATWRYVLRPNDERP